MRPPQESDAWSWDVQIVRSSTPEERHDLVDGTHAASGCQSRVDQGAWSLESGIARSDAATATPILTADLPIGASGECGGNRTTQPGDRRNSSHGPLWLRYSGAPILPAVKALVNILT